MKNIVKIVLDPFCYRQFEKYQSTAQSSSIIISFDPVEFANKINDYYFNAKDRLKDGYAPFCKHLFIENFTSVPASTVKITDENQSSIMYNNINFSSGYEARTEKELAVLRRFIPISKINLVKAKYLDIILYSKEQICKESLAMNNTDPNENIDYEYGIISVKPQNVDYELPMDPITIMRNALGVEFGGSGINIDFGKYCDSVKFWSENVILK